MYTKAVIDNNVVQNETGRAYSFDFPASVIYLTPHFIIIRFCLAYFAYCSVLYMLYYSFHAIFLIKILRTTYIRLILCAEGRGVGDSKGWWF
jgi:hypothetical protein